MNKSPTCRRPINLDRGNHVGRERLTSATSRHSGVCGLELEIAFFYFNFFYMHAVLQQIFIFPKNKRERGGPDCCPGDRRPRLIERTDEG